MLQERINNKWKAELENAIKVFESRVKDLTSENRNLKDK